MMVMRMFATVINPVETSMRLKNNKIMCTICHEEKENNYHRVLEVRSVLN